MNWLIGRLRWILVLAALGGPVVAFMGFSEAGKLSKLETEGATAEAVITEAYKKSGRRSGASFKLSLAWEDASGSVRTANDITIDSDYANTLISYDELTTDVVSIYYMENDAAIDPVVAGSLEGEKETATLMKYAGIVAGIVGILGALGMFWMRRKKV